MWTKYVGRFGLANGPDCFLKACEEIKKVNSKAGEKNNGPDSFPKACEEIEKVNSIPRQVKKLIPSDNCQMVF